MFSRLEDSTDLQELSSYLGSSRRAAACRRTTSPRRWPTRRRPSRRDPHVGGLSSQSAKQGIVEAVEAAWRSGRQRRSRSSSLSSRAFPLARDRRTSTRRRSGFARASSGDPSGFEAAAARFREVDLPFWLAVTLLEYGELTGDESSLDGGTRDLRAARGAAVARAARCRGTGACRGARVTCPTCGSENREGRKFCGECGIGARERRARRAAHRTRLA